MELVRQCQCRWLGNAFLQCTREMTAEDLVCDHCREAGGLNACTAPESGDHQGEHMHFTAGKIEFSFTPRLRA